MDVGELIKELNKYPSYAEVYLADTYHDGSWVCTGITDDTDIDACIVLYGKGFPQDNETNKLKQLLEWYKVENKELRSELNRRNLKKEIMELNSEHPYCYKKVECGRFDDGTPSYAMHNCLLRAISYDDGKSTSYCCSIDKGEAGLDTPCRHWELFNCGNLLVKEKYIK